MGLGALRDVSLKQARECANQWRSVLREGRDPIKERNKQKREAVSNLHYLKDIALETFESRKTELKGDGKNGDWFSPLRLYILYPLELFQRVITVSLETMKIVKNLPKLEIKETE